MMPIPRLLVVSIGSGWLVAACATSAPAPSAVPTAAPAPAEVVATTTPVAPVAASATPQPTIVQVTPASTATLSAAVAPTATLVGRQAPASANTISIATPTRDEQVEGPGPATETSNIAAEFEAALNSGRVDAALGLFAENAEVKVPPDRYVGRGQIENWLRYLAAIHFEIEPGFRRVVGAQASWPAEIRSDYLDHIGLPSLNGEASMVVQDSRIQNYTFYLTEDSSRRHRDALLHASEVLQDPLIVGQDAANIYGFDDVFFDANGHMISYRDVLTAEPGSGPFHDLGGQPVVIHSGY
jgi:hypothetical protein